MLETQCAAVCCIVLQRGAVWCSVLQCVAVCCSVSQYQLDSVPCSKQAFQITHHPRVGGECFIVPYMKASCAYIQMNSG